MKKLIIIFVCMLSMLFAQQPAAQAEDAAVLMDKFYDGLAAIIERNMNNPKQCVSEVNNYYETNRATVEKIRKISAEAINKGMAMMKQLEETGNIAVPAGQAEQAPSQLAEMSKSTEMQGSSRYSKALQVFSEKYPTQGMQIAIKAMQLLPGLQTDE